MSVSVTGGVTYYARVDSGTANNNALNPDGAGNVLSIKFVNDDPDIAGVDTLGDYNLNYSTAGYDPNTMVVYNGVPYKFDVDLVGTMGPTAGAGGYYPPGARVDQMFLSQQVVVITFTDNANVVHRVFFYPNIGQTAAERTAIGNIRNGQISLATYSLTCLCEGTKVLTPNGTRAIETVCVGDFLLNEDGVAKQVIWVGNSVVSAVELGFDKDLRPIRIPAGALGAAGPLSDLCVSPQHRVVIEGAAPALLFGEDRVLVAAKHLVPSGIAEVTNPTEEVRYYHVLLEEHELLVTNGLVTESFQPARRTLDVMSPDNQQRLLAAIEALGAEAMLTRPDALPALSGREARVLLDRLQHFDGILPGAATGKPKAARRLNA